MYMKIALRFIIIESEVRWNFFIYLILLGREGNGKGKADQGKGGKVR
jgi:hypothetical protein